MHRLLEFFYQYRAFLFFILLETISFWLIVQNNNYQSAAFFNSSNKYVGGVLEVKNNIQSYFELKQVNRLLAEENAKLKQTLMSMQQGKDLHIENKSDWLKVNQYEYYPVKVINNSTGDYRNFLTINKGTQDGLRKGMGLISPEGVAGIIKDCSDHYCTAYSILHTDLTILSKIKTKGINCNVHWEGYNPYEISLQHVPRNEKISVGDTVITSGFNTYFPEGIMIGKIKDVKLEGGSFWRATVELSTEFNSLSYVYAIGNKMEQEQDSLQKASTPKEK